MLPKKGRRQIVVDDKTYYYFVKRLKDNWETHAGAPVVRLTIQLSEVRYHTETETNPEFTPSYIEKVIRRYLTNEK